MSRTKSSSSLGGQTISDSENSFDPSSAQIEERIENKKNGKSQTSKTPKIK
ncbi:hypothetical protein [Leptospira santarosai]